MHYKTNSNLKSVPYIRWCTIARLIWRVVCTLSPLQYEYYDNSPKIQKNKVSSSNFFTQKKIIVASETVHVSHRKAEMYLNIHFTSLIFATHSTISSIFRLTKNIYSSDKVFSVAKGPISLRPYYSLSSFISYRSGIQHQYQKWEWFLALQEQIVSWIVEWLIGVKSDDCYAKL